MMALLAVALSACADSVSAGPLASQYDDVSSRSCAPMDMLVDRAAAFGDIYIENPTDGELTVTDVSLLESDGVRLIGAVISAPDAESIWNIGYGWPPEGEFSDLWATETSPLVGARVGDRAVPYSEDQTEYEVISLGLRLDEGRRRGSAHPVVLDYEVDGKPYRVEIERTYQFRPNCG